MRCLVLTDKRRPKARDPQYLLGHVDPVVQAHQLQEEPGRRSSHCSAHNTPEPPVCIQEAPFRGMFPVTTITTPRSLQLLIQYPLPHSARLRQGGRERTFGKYEHHSPSFFRGSFKLAAVSEENACEGTGTATHSNAIQSMLHCSRMVPSVG